MDTFIKYIQSFFKSDWTLEDYPIEFRHFDIDESSMHRRFTPAPWFVRIANWWAMFGHGQTKTEAYGELKRRFDEYKNRGLTLPRPGARKRPQIEMASRVEIEQYEQVAIDFFEKILGMSYRDCLITDESSLWDFPGDETNTVYHHKIAEVYGTDASDIESGNLVQIFRRISEKGKKA